ncbi:MAG: SRPBCC family protein [Alphaproteobacteria bacterium]|nr:SRPBCC family protein [Alphaproteobacteria bacterium]
MSEGDAVEDSLTRQVFVPGAPADAYRLFVHRFRDWWPADYTFSREDLAEIAIEGAAGGRCIERDRLGKEWVWGTVIGAEPPHRLVFRWHITGDRQIETDPDRASEVEVRFAANGQDRTEVILKHRGFARHGDGWRDYLSGMASDQGWSWCLELYRQAASM